MTGRCIVLQRWLLLASLFAAPTAAHAQFATFIPPKAKATDSASAVTAAVKKAKQDSMSAARIANMKTWVDSAAGLPPRPTRAADSVLAPSDTIPVQVATARGRTSPAIPAPVTTRVSTTAGARAPATASELPLLLLVGSLLLMTGIVLLASDPRRRRRQNA
jgi:hypothetical protein